HEGGGRGEGRAARDGERRRERGERRREAPDAPDAPAAKDGVSIAPVADGVPSVEVSLEGPVARPAHGRVFVTLGEADGADEAKVREAVAALAPDVAVAVVELRRTHSFVEVAPDAVDPLVAAIDGKEWGGKKLAAERARRRRHR
ncbi:DbpA RNA binding domain-containing protein, partial [Anaeromyxobacter oryzisoli]|uniref:DbpA RNA binding domain-containing protein n=1 Tax=Anaeromyxobacter oryzisoli TaxID=2925408 RepID=UPI001F578DE0